MSDFRRLRDLHEDDVIGAAFRSADQDGPTTGADTKLLAALGVGVSAIAAAAATAPVAGTAAAGAGAAGVSSLVAKVGGTSVLAKWLVGSALVVSTSVAGTMLVDAPKKAPVAVAPSSSQVSRGAASPKRAPAPSAPVVESASAAEATEEAPAPPVETAPPAPEPVHVAASPRPHAASSASSPAKAAVDPSRVEQAPMVELPKVAASAPVEAQVPADLDRARGMIASAQSLAPELSELEHVRSLLASGRASDALTAVDEYRRAFPRGILVQESEVLRLDALVRLGRRADVEREGRAFLEQHPQSPQAPRVRALLARDGASLPTK